LNSSPAALFDVNLIECDSDTDCKLKMQRAFAWVKTASGTDPEWAGTSIKAPGRPGSGVSDYWVFLSGELITLNDGNSGELSLERYRHKYLTEQISFRDAVSGGFDDAKLGVGPIECEDSSDCGRKWQQGISWIAHASGGKPTISTPDQQAFADAGSGTKYSLVQARFGQAGIISLNIVSPARRNEVVYPADWLQDQKSFRDALTKSG
jgi:hypothetical protein